MISDYPDDVDFDPREQWPDADDRDDEDDDDEGELSEEDLDEAIACALAEEPELASELEILRQYPTFLKAIARVVRCTNMDLPESGENDDALLAMVRAEEPQLTTELEQIIDEE